MYFWLFVVIGLFWLWLAGSAFAAWRTRRLHGFWSLVSILVLTGGAASIILFAAPYWTVVYRVLLQPG